MITIFVMVFGALVASAGIVMMYTGKANRGKNTIEAFGAEFVLSTPSLVVLLVGAAIFVLPVVQPLDKSKSASTPSQQASGQPSTAGAASSSAGPGSPGSPPQQSQGGLSAVGTPSVFEKEPNGGFATATEVQVGVPLGAQIGSPDDEDYFHFTAPNKQSVRIRLADYAKGTVFTVNVFNASKANVGNFTSGPFDASAEFQATVGPNEGVYVVLALISGDGKSYTLRVD